MVEPRTLPRSMLSLSASTPELECFANSSASASSRSTLVSRSSARIPLDPPSPSPPSRESRLARPPCRQAPLIASSGSSPSKSSDPIPRSDARLDALRTFRKSAPPPPPPPAVRARHGTETSQRTAPPIISTISLTPL
eukprot:849127-Prorocentrum_minimum.AAC.2